jgi:Zn-dependent M28 family amino/carboxypeptidase
MRPNLAVLSGIALMAGSATATWAAPTAITTDPAALKATITHLVGFGTRHTLSDTQSDTRGIGAARRWIASQFAALSASCGGCLIVETPGATVSGKRVPNPTLVQDVLAIQPGVSDPGRVVIISGHIDSRVTDILNASSDAPGANDDASGVAAVMEAARVLSARKFPATIVYAVLSGEEQGLYGGQVLADTAKAKGWRVEAVLNNDIVGNTHGQDGRIEDRVVRVFSEGTRADESAKTAAERRRNGGEVDAPSRELSRYMAAVALRDGADFKVRQIWRADRFGRGGDQAPMQAAGYPAVRVTEADENYTRQHQDLRTENGVAYGDVIAGVDFPYLAKVARLDAETLAALASAPAPPPALRISGAVTADTTLSWGPAPGAAHYKVWWRETTEPDWTHSRDAGAATTLTVMGVNIDDYDFGVSSVAADGAESPVEFPGSAGAFVDAEAAKP